jgi:hypothetical protein
MDALNQMAIAESLVPMTPEDCWVRCPEIIDMQEEVNRLFDEFEYLEEDAKVVEV